MGHNKADLIKHTLNLIYKVSGPAILIYLFWLIGFTEIKNTLLKLTLQAIVVIFALKILATLCRIAKYVIFNQQVSLLKNCEIYLSAKIGGELSILGHFSPLLKDEFRNSKTVKLLLLDRYLEILATFGIAFVCALFLLPQGKVYILLAIFFLGCCLISIMPFFYRVSFRGNWNFANKITSMGQKLHDYLRENSRVIMYMFILSVMSSLIEFYIVKLIFSCINSPVNFAIVPIIWAIGGIIGYITFLSVGTAEITSLLLYSKLAKIEESSIATMIIVARIFITLSSIAVFLTITALKLINRYPAPPQLLDAQHNSYASKD